MDEGKCEFCGSEFVMFIGMENGTKVEVIKHYSGCPWLEETINKYNKFRKK